MPMIEQLLYVTDKSRTGCVLLKKMLVKYWQYLLENNCLSNKFESSTPAILFKKESNTDVFR